MQEDLFLSQVLGEKERRNEDVKRLVARASCVPEAERQLSGLVEQEGDVSVSDCWQTGRRRRSAGQ